MVIYLDAYFFWNLLMNFCVLDTQRIIIGCKSCWWKMMLASVLGSVYSIIAVIMWNNQIVIMMLLFIVTCLINNVLCFGYKGIKNTLKNSCVTLISLFALSSLMYRMSYLTNDKSMTKMVFMVLGAKLLIDIAYKWIIRSNILEREHYRAFKFESLVKKPFDVVLDCKGRQLNAVALIDTGNSLREPILGRPVAVISNSLYIRMLDNKLLEERIEDMKRDVVAIPFSSVGTKNGILYGFCADFIRIVDKSNRNGGTIQIRKPILAVYNQEFIGRKKYDILLHPKMIEGAVENDSKWNLHKG